MSGPSNNDSVASAAIDSNEEHYSCGQAEDPIIHMAPNHDNQPSNPAKHDSHATCNARIDILIEKQAKLLRRLEIAMMENQKTWNALEQSEERIQKLEESFEEERTLHISEIARIDKMIKDDALKITVQLIAEKLKTDNIVKSHVNDLRLQILRINAKNLIKDHVSVSVWGTNYCWLGAAFNEWSLKGSAGKLDFDSSRYMTFGNNGAWYRHWHVGKDCTTEFSANFAKEYSQLHQLLQGKTLRGCPGCISLGENGRYFVRMKGVRLTAGNLPPSYLEDGRTLQQIENIWFGKDDTYVSVSTAGVARVELKGKYNEDHLKKLILERKAKLKALSLNLIDENSFVAVWDDGWASFGEGNKTFSGQSFKEWTVKNFALSWATTSSDSRSSTSSK